MIEKLKENIWQQFGASIDTLENAIQLCPEDIMQQHKRLFNIMYHTLVFLDYYTTLPPQNFSSPLPYTYANPDNLPEEAIDDLIPDRLYTKNELLTYLQRSREKARQLVSGLTETDILHQRFTEDFEDAMDYSVIEILLYNMRHVQHHAAQLNLLLRQTINKAPKWVFMAKDKLKQ